MTNARMPLVIGVDALWRIAAGAALLPIGAVAAASAIDGGSGGVVRWIAAGLFGAAGLGMLVWGYASRAADVVLDGSGLRVEGGPRSGTALPWQQLSAAELRGHSTAVDTPLELLVRTRDGRELRLGEGTDLIEKTSLQALHATFLDALGQASPEPPRASHVAACTGCGAALRPSAEAAVRCGACGTTNAMGPAVRERVAAQRATDEALRSAATSVQRLLEQPGARRSTWTLLLALAVAGVAWGLVLQALVGTGFRDIGSFELGLGYFNGWLTTVAAFCFARIALARRRALLLLSAAFGARPPRAAGLPATCRECGGALPEGAHAIARCVYCSAENILGLGVRCTASDRARSYQGRIDGLLSEESRERSYWLKVGAGATLAALVAGFWLMAQVAVMRDFAAKRARCEKGHAEACYDVAVDYRLGISVAKDEAKGARYLRRACEDDHAEACSDLGLATYYGWGVERDAVRGRALLDRACKDGFEKACKELTELIE